MMFLPLLLLSSTHQALAQTTTTTNSCPDFSVWSKTYHAPFSSGRHNLSYARPAPACRTFNSSAVEAAVASMAVAVADPDLFRLFENAFPNTLDTAVRWRGLAAGDPRQELAFLITGDIDAMWLRDSANQLHSYAGILSKISSSSSTTTTTDSSADDTSGNGTTGDLASLFRGVINLQARYLLTAPFCNAFQPPAESGIAPAVNSAAADDVVYPPYSNQSVFECKYELDSLAAFLQLSADYLDATDDGAFFSASSNSSVYSPNWLPALRGVLSVARSMRDAPTYDPSTGAVLQAYDPTTGTVLHPAPYTFERLTTRQTETMANYGLGSPAGAGTGLVRTAFRPSDDAALFPFLVPANMMFSAGLARVARVAEHPRGLADPALAAEMRAFAAELRVAVETYAVVTPARTAGSNSNSGSDGGTAYAYEVDGFGSASMMDDANIPSLLAAPVFGYVNASDATYQRTRARILGAVAGNNNTNPYMMRGSVLAGVGGPHIGPGMSWPMASVVRVLTSDDDAEIAGQLRQLVGSTAGLGLVHESVNASDSSVWTRQWFSWANGLFGEMILDLATRKPEILSLSYQFPSGTE